MLNTCPRADARSQDQCDSQPYYRELAELCGRSQHVDRFAFTKHEAAAVMASSGVRRRLMFRIVLGGHGLMGTGMTYATGVAVGGGSVEWKPNHHVVGVEAEQTYRRRR